MRKRDSGTQAVSIVLGAALTGGAVIARITALSAWSPICVDGRQVGMMANNILGNNYVKLRGIGKAVDFNVYYQDGIQVDSSSPYTGETPAKADSQPAVSEAHYISSTKGTELTVGERSLLVIRPNGLDCTAISNNPAVVALDQVAGY